MDRKSFLKSAGLLTGGLILTPKILFNKPQDNWEWFGDNYHWLKNWLNNFEIIKPFYKDDKTCQLFMDTHYYRSQPQQWQLDNFNKEHQIILLRAAVFSKYSFLSNADRPNKTPGEFYNIVAMSGFVEQKGRLPKKSDKVIFEICPPDSIGQRFLRTKVLPYHEGTYISKHLSDCRLKVV